MSEEMREEAVRQAKEDILYSESGGSRSPSHTLPTVSST